MKTHDGIELKIGDKLKDNDPRMENRLLEIVSFYDEERISVRSMSGTISKIKANRIHADGKPRRSGFDLVRTLKA